MMSSFLPPTAVESENDDEPLFVDSNEISSRQIAATLESLDRLACHIPRSVVDQMMRRVLEEHHEEEDEHLRLTQTFISDDNDCLARDDDDGENDEAEAQKSKKFRGRTIAAIPRRSSRAPVEVLFDDDMESLHACSSLGGGGTSFIEDLGAVDSISSDSSDEDSILSDDLDFLVSVAASTRSFNNSVQSAPTPRQFIKEEDEEAVCKLRQGRLSDNNLVQLAGGPVQNNERSTNKGDSSHPSLTTWNNKDDGSNVATILTCPTMGSHRGNDKVLQSLPPLRHSSALLFVDISGFTQLSRALPVEPLSKVINTYLETIVQEIASFGGDIQKFAGDALIVEWKHQEELDCAGTVFSKSQAVLLAATCAASLVHRCSDFQVHQHQADEMSPIVATLNIHCAIGYGTVVGAHVGNPRKRMEFVLLGDPFRQIAQAMGVAKRGEVVASPEALNLLKESVDLTDLRHCHCHDDNPQQPQVIAFKCKRGFNAKCGKRLPDSGNALLTAIATAVPVSKKCHGWTQGQLDRLQRLMSPYVHDVVLNEYFADGEQPNEEDVAPGSNSCILRNSTHVKQQKSASEVRDVLTMFIQPTITEFDLMGPEAESDEVLTLLNAIMQIVTCEVEHFKAHLRQFIVDDKGLVIIVNFGLRGSTFPGMVEERAMPCIANIRTLFRTELGLDCNAGVTFGNAFCGIVGGRKRHEFAVLGSCVNLAARLMAQKQGILVDQAVRHKAKESPFKSLRPINAKGYDDPVMIFQPEKTQRKSWNQPSPDFVGREKEILQVSRMANTIFQIDERHGRLTSKIVFISAPYGTGKSALLSTVVHKIEADCKKASKMHHTTRHVFCEEDAFRPFSIVRPLFLEVLRRKQNMSAPTFERLQVPNQAQSELRSEVQKQEEAQLYVLLLQLCLEAQIPMQYAELFASIIFSSKLADIGTWSEASRKMSEWNKIAKFLVVAYLHCTKYFDLVLLAFDDVFGIDEMSWKIIQRLHQTAKKVMIITSARSEHSLNIVPSFWSALNGCGKNDTFLHIRLKPLEEFDFYTLACKLLGVGTFTLDQKIAKTVFFLSQGNPLLAIEIFNYLYKDKRNAHGNGDNEDRMKEILVNRLDALSPTVRLHLNCGAIFGLTFQLSDVIEVMERYNGIPDGDKRNHAEAVCKSLNEAADHGFLSISSPSKDAVVEYSFSHPLWQETISKLILQDWKESMLKLAEAIKSCERAKSIFGAKEIQFNNLIKEAQAQLRERGSQAVKLATPASPVRLL